MVARVGETTAEEEVDRDSTPVRSPLNFEECKTCVGVGVRSRF